MSMQEIATLEQQLKLLIREWERYFAGDRKVPPVKERSAMQRRLRALAEKPSIRKMEQYRLEQLQHRFQTYAQNWERMLREREEGRGRFPLRKPGTPPPPPPRPSSRESPNAAAASSVKNESGDLYQRYMAARKQSGDNASVDQQAFQNQIEAQRKKLEGRLGHQVRFDVVVEGGKVKLAARKQAGKSPQE